MALDPVAEIADQIDELKRQTRSSLRIGTVTALEAVAPFRVRLDITEDGWVSTDADLDLKVGDRVYVLQQGGVWVVSGRLDGTAAVPPIGSMTMWPAAAAPAGWLLCQGQSLLRTDYPDLFAVLGTTYGSADSTHFTLPNLVGRFPFGDDASTALGSTGGAKTVTLTDAQMPSHTHAGPSHTHSFSGSDSHTHTIPNGGGTIAINQGTSGGTTSVASTASGTTGSATVSISGTTGSASGTTGSAGGDASHENMPPWLAINFIIRAV